MKIVLMPRQESVWFQRALVQLTKLYGQFTMEYYTSSQENISCNVNGKRMKFIPMNKIKEMSYDAMLIVGTEYDREKIEAECQFFGIDKTKIIYDYEAAIPGFTVQKSNRLHRSKVSIFSINGWGNNLYKKFHMQVLTPFVNTAMKTKDWMNFLATPDIYLSKELVLDGKFTHFDGKEFSIFRMGENGPKIYMLCETDKEVFQLWKESVNRINWKDLIIMMYTEYPEILDGFDRLPYGKKICFTSFESNLDSAFYIPKERGDDGEVLPLWASVDRLTETEQPTYDLWDMLLYGRRTHLRYVSDSHA